MSPTEPATVRAHLVAHLLAAHPDSIRAVYLEGSQADETSLATSDTDLTIIVADGCSGAERATIRESVRAVGAEYRTELDADISDEATLERGVTPMLKEASRLLWGDPVVARLPLMPIDAWTRDRMHTSYWRVANLFGRGGPLVVPLRYPDPHDEFFGYCRRTVHLADGTAVPSTRDLIRHVGWIATALIAHQAGRYVARKRDCHRLYREVIGDEWSDLPADIYKCCRGAWSYLLPAALDDRARLRAICARTLRFERHFVSIYRDYALSELCSETHEGRAMAAGVLRRVPFPDVEVTAALSELSLEEGL